MYFDTVVLLQYIYVCKVYLSPFTCAPQAFESVGLEDGVVPHTPVLEGKQLPMGSQSQTIPCTPSDPPSSAVPQLAMSTQATGGKQMNEYVPQLFTIERKVPFLDRK